MFEMKKAYSIAALAAFSIVFGQQIKTESRVKWGLKAGMNSSKIIINEETIGKSRTGIYLGAFANIRIGRVFSIQPEVFYSQTGYKGYIIDGEFLTQSGKLFIRAESKAQLDYISIPIIFQFNITPSFYLEVGPQLNFLVNNKMQNKLLNIELNGKPLPNELLENTVNQSINKHNKVDTDNIEAGFSFGTGYYFTPHIGLSFRYSFTASGMNSQNNMGIQYDNSDSKITSLLQLGAIYRF